MDDLMKNIIVHTPCKVTYENGNDLLYFLEFFSRSKENMTDFLSRLNIQAQISDNTFLANGSNELLYITKKNEKIIQAENTLWCNLNENIINKIINNTPIEDRYNNFFLSNMFGDTDEKIIAKNNDMYYENDYMIMFPNIVAYYINTNILSEIKNLKDKKNNNKYVPTNLIKNVTDHFKDIVMMIFIKPDNYNELKTLYDKNDIYLLKHKLSESRYISSLKLNKNDVNLLKNIKKSVYYFYKFIDSKTDNIRIDVSDMMSNNMWISINVHYRDIYDGEFQYKRLTQMYRDIEINELINILEHDNSLDNKLKKTLSHSKIKDYNLTTGKIFDGEDCIINDNPIRRDVNLPYYSNNNKIQNKPYLIKKGSYHKINNFEYNRFITDKLATTSTLCSKTICLKINNEHYLVNIIPKTAAYTTKINDPIKYLSNNKLINTIEYDDIVLQYVYKNDLKYWIQFIHLDNHDCLGNIINNKLTTSKTINNLVFNIQKKSYIKLYENNIIAESLLSCYKNNFQTKISFILYNIIRSCTQIYRQTKNKNIIDILSNIINIETMYNKKLLEKVTEEINNNPNNKVIEEIYKKLITNDQSFFKKLLQGYKDIDAFCNNKLNIFTYDNLQYIAIPSRHYLENKLKENEKYLIWFCGPTLNDFDELMIIINNMKSYITNFDIDFDKLKSMVFLENLDVKMHDIAKIYNMPTNQYYSYIQNNYMINIFSLYNSDGSFNIYKYQLDDFIKYFIRELNKSYYFSIFHYVTGIMMSTLHIHIYFKATRGSDRGTFRKINSKIAYSKGSNFFLEYIDNFNLPYDRINKNYYFNHQVPIEIFNLNKLIKNIKNTNFINDNDILEFVNKNITKKLASYVLTCDKYLHDLYYPDSDIGDANFNTLKKFILYYKNDYKM